MKLKTAVKPITELKNHTAEVVRQVSEQGQPVVITQNGEAKVVVMDVETFDRWRDAMAILRLLAHGQADVEAGRTISTDEVFSRAATAVAHARKHG